MPSRITIAVSVALIASAGAVGFAYAENDPGDAQEDAQEATAQGVAKLSMSEAVALAENEVPGGRVVSSQIDTENGIVSYVIDIEKDGLQSVMIGVRTGEVISVGAAEADDLDQTAAVADEDDEEEEEDAD